MTLALDISMTKEILRYTYRILSKSVVRNPSTIGLLPVVSTYENRRAESLGSKVDCEYSEKENEKALDIYGYGWGTGDTSIILGAVKYDYTFTWLPEDAVFSKTEFSSFFEDFKNNAEANGRPKYKMNFSSIIRKKIGDTLFEFGDWIVEGFARGTYFQAAKCGKVLFEEATT